MRYENKRASPAPRIVVMGASGCGKTAIGTLLAQQLGVVFIDGDDLHPATNIAKMTKSIPLIDDDRRPWLTEVGRTLNSHDATGAVIACSALRVSYRDIIRREEPRTFFVHLLASRAELMRRLTSRTGHFMPVSLLDDQLQTLEPLRASEHGITINVDQTLDQVVGHAERGWRMRSDPERPPAEH